MSGKEAQGDLDQKEDQADVGESTENAEYEDDFEKDTECLTDEEEKQNLGEKENPEEKEEDVEAKIFKTADSFQEDNKEMKENLDQLSEAEANVKVIYSNEKYLKSEADIEQEGHESDAERESSVQESRLENEQELDEGEDEEIKRYVLEKIEEANKELENQAPMDKNRERKLKFEDEVGLQAGPPEDAEVGKTDLARAGDVSDRLSQLNISDNKGQKSTSLSACAGLDEEKTDGKILVEKDENYELLCICDIESQGILAPVRVYFTDTETQQTTELFSSLPTVSQAKEMPPSDSKQQPDSALNGAKDVGKQKTECANIPVKSSTYSLTPRQKELRRQIELRKERLKREEEEKKRELEEMRRRQNEMVFKAWLQKKKEQVQQEKRIRRAKLLEEQSIKEVHRDPEEAYRLWLKKKHQQYVRERRTEVLRRQTEEVAFFTSAEDCDRAFRDWLRKKREEKQAAELAAKERAKQLRLEARRARKMRSIHYI
ncbi:Coiled-coil domain-containing protein 181 [Lonchura striata]|uniref:Coiled-coil domain-containing protein 181 n=1 Tax=Lonchura striata TaxID=40157 RepID=A0A218VCV6_9PASE|nr:coiled-coil domain-containing protein 181 [Lonchura striata domestica]OWK63924.1 Coiled-coil domain-containing protein 181 [Lonchura striata domestica]